MPEPKIAGWSRKGRVLAGLALALLPFCGPHAQGQPARAAAAVHPNIILIVADDLGYGDLGPYGQHRIMTPTIDRMAASGTMFTNFYAGSPACAPSRCTLLTGKNGGSCPIRTNFHATLPGDEVTLGERMQAAGYTTAIFGKWGQGNANTPRDSLHQGFAYSFGYQDQLSAHLSYPGFLWASGGQAFTGSIPRSGAPLRRIDVNGAYAPDLIHDQAMAFINNAPAEPFFLYYATTIPHANNEEEGDGILESPDLGPYADRDWTLPNRTYAALITRLDDHIREIWEAAQTDTIRPTVIIVTADNGPHGIAGVDIGFFDSTGGLRGSKYSLHEGGIRVPLIVWSNAPNVPVPAAKVDDRPTYFPDLTATTLALAGVAIPAELSGIDILATDRTDDPERPLYWEFHAKAHGGWAVRTGPWKTVSSEMSDGWERLLSRILRLDLVGRGTPAEPQLYNLATDPGETVDLAGEHPEIVARHLAIAREQHVSPRVADALDMFRRREGINKYHLMRFGAAVAALVVLLAFVPIRRRIPRHKKKSLAKD